MSCSDFKSGTVNLRGMKRKLDMKLNGDRLRKQLTRGPSPPTTQRSKLSHPSEDNRNRGQPLQSSGDPLHHHNYHHQLKSQGDQLLCRLRQTMFNISLAKLSRYRHIPDPSLLRSVMICNTLKRLEKDLENEGIKVSFGPNGVYFLPNNTQNSTINPNANNPTIETHSLPPSDQCTISSSSPPSSPNDAIVSSQNPSSCNQNEISNGGEETFLIDLDSGGRVTPFPGKMDISGNESDSSLSSSETHIDVIDTDSDIWQAQDEKWPSSAFIPREQNGDARRIERWPHNQIPVRKSIRQRSP